MVDFADPIDGLVEDPFADMLEPSLDVDAFSFNGILIGPPKTGKTAGAASAPGPILYLNSEVEQRLRYARMKYGEKLKVINVRSAAQMRKIWKLLEGPHPYKTIVVDSIGELYNALLAELAKQNTGTMKNKPKLDQYGEAGEAVRTFCKMLIQLQGINTVFVAHDFVVTDEATGTSEHLPLASTTGKGGVKLGRQLLGYVDVIGYTGVTRDAETGAEEYVALLRPHNGYPGGDGFNCLADEKGMRKVDLSEWIEHIKAHQGDSIEGVASA